jgi:hypothetical protein
MACFELVCVGIYMEAIVWLLIHIHSLLFPFIYALLVHTSVV